MREQGLVKMKRFITDEGRVIGHECLYHNENPVSLSETGYAERSSHRGAMIPMDALGALILENALGQFKVGTGFSSAQRKELWEMRDSLIGKIVTFKHQPHGAKNLPRIPVFVGIRDERDTSK